MKINSFSCRNLNGYLNFDLRFFGSVSFLVGINGSGKTSVLKATMSLLGPDLDWLVNADFHSISISLNHNEKEIIISAKKVPSGLKFSFLESGNLLEYNISHEIYRNIARRNDEYVRDEDGEIIRIRENRSEIPGNIPPFEAVKRLPTPIFLGLDRTTLPTNPNRIPSRVRRPTPSRRPHATLRAFLDESVSQAEAIAIDAIRGAHLMRSRQAVALREKVLLTLFSDTAVNEETEVPKAQDLRRYEKSQRSLKGAFSLLGIDKVAIESVIDPFFANVMSIGSAISHFKDSRELVRSGDDAISNFLAWIALRPRLNLMSQVEHLVSMFNEEEKKIFSRTNKYLEIMNSFLLDSRKKMDFREDSSLFVELPSGSPGDVYYLSSGERQLFVLITTLMFSDDTSRANAVIIDEPELSLHLKWQEMFVDALLKANPNIQLILATHSPSIILDKDEFCVDLV